MVNYEASSSTALSFRIQHLQSNKRGTVRKLKISLRSQAKNVLRHQSSHEQNTSSPPIITFCVGFFSIFAAWTQRRSFIDSTDTLDLFKRSTAIASPANAPKCHHAVIGCLCTLAFHCCCLFGLVHGHHHSLVSHVAGCLDAANGFDGDTIRTAGCL